MRRAQPHAVDLDVPATADMGTRAQRLLDIHATAKYLGGVSPWTIRALVADGHLRPVRLPSVRHRGENGRRLLFDRADLDVAIALWKAQS